MINLARDLNQKVEAKYDNVFAQDTMAAGNLTVTAGLRYDKQGGSNAPKTVAANSFRPDLLPAVNYSGGASGFEWKSITPRLGLTYALGAERKTLLRASYSQFADQLATGLLGQLNPLGNLSYVYFYADAPLGANGALPPGCCVGPP